MVDSRLPQSPAAAADLTDVTAGDPLHNEAAPVQDGDSGGVEDRPVGVFLLGPPVEAPRHRVSKLMQDKPIQVVLAQGPRLGGPADDPLTPVADVEKGPFVATGAMFPDDRAVELKARSAAHWSPTGAKEAQRVLVGYPDASTGLLRAHSKQGWPTASVGQNGRSSRHAIRRWYRPPASVSLFRHPPASASRPPSGRW